MKILNKVTLEQSWFPLCREIKKRKVILRQRETPWSECFLFFLCPPPPTLLSWYILWTNVSSAGMTAVSTSGGFLLLSIAIFSLYSFFYLDFFFFCLVFILSLASVVRVRCEVVFCFVYQNSFPYIPVKSLFALFKKALINEARLCNMRIVTMFAIVLVTDRFKCILNM